VKFASTVVTRVIETEMPLLDPAELYPDSTPEILAREAHWLMPRFQCPDTQKLILTMQGFVLQSHGKTILVDTCVGDCKHRARPLFDQQRWGWLDRFRATGFDPEGVDIVLSTHLHVDHVGWNTTRDDTGQPGARCCHAPVTILQTVSFRSLRQGLPMWWRWITALTQRFVFYPRPVIPRDMSVWRSGAGQTYW
jgi:hypothetical protein